MDVEYRVLFAEGDVEGEWWVVLLDQRLRLQGKNLLLAKFATEEEAKVAVREFKIDDDEDRAHGTGIRRFQS
jgi:hypothetical protein